MSRSWAIARIAVPMKVRAQEEIERDRADQRHREGQQARRADVDVAELDDRQAHADVAELGAEQQRGEALQEEQQAAGGQQLVDRRRAENRRDDQEMHEHAEAATPAIATAQASGSGQPNSA